MKSLYDDLRDSPAQIELLARGVLLVLCFSLAAAKGTADDHLLWLSALGPVALLSSLPSLDRRAVLVAVTLESSMSSIAVLSTGSEGSVFLPYLLAPAFSGALRLGAVGAFVPPGAAAFTLLLGRAVREQVSGLADFAAVVALWVVLACFIGLVTAWARHVAATAAEADPEGAQKAAYDLLNRLRTVARRLPGTLDPTSTAQALLRSARAVAPYDEGAVLVRSSGSRLVPLAITGGGRPDWEVSLSADGPIADAWASQEVQLRERRLPRISGTSVSGSSLVVPLAVGLRTLGLLVLESERPRTWTSAAARQVAAHAGDVTLQLESGLLFDEVRTLATTEERNRVAREIHDGIAQELVFLGYSVDNLTLQAGKPGAQLAKPLQDLRTEITRLVSDLRLSLFDLRADVDAGAGLGTALSDYVRRLGTQTDLTVHLSLTESALRLPTHIEVDLLRIAQEAVANVRKHAQAENLWVTCVVNPPQAAITVEDDGVGIRVGARTGSYGLDIMRERADRLGALLTVGPRSGGGTVVEVRLGTLSGTGSSDVRGERRKAGKDADDGAARR